jgi:NAD+ kinase
MIGVIAHIEKEGAGLLTRRMIDALAALDLEVCLESRTAQMIGRPAGESIPALAEKVDLLLVLGGDGTILRVIHQIPGAIPSVFGVNIGSLGFLTCVGPDELQLAAQSIKDRSFVLSRRHLLHATLHRMDGTSASFEGVNDVVITRGERSQLVKLRVFIDGELLTEYYADGLIVATPTGSTAYSLSSGGPILMPESGGLVITPICPHVLTNRSVVVGEGSVITLESCGNGPQEIVLVEDGRDPRKLLREDRVNIRRSERVLPLAMLPGRSFSQVLSQKLKWSGSNI